MQLGILKKTGFCMAFHFGFWIATKVRKGSRRCMLQKPQEQIVSEAPVDDGETTTTRPAPTLLKLTKTAQLMPIRVLQHEKDPPQVARSRQKKKERNRTRPKKRTMRMATRRMKKRIWIKYWGRSRSGCGHPPLTLMQVLMMRLKTSRRRKRRLLQVQSSSRHRFLVLGHPVAPLPP